MAQSFGTRKKARCAMRRDQTLHQRLIPLLVEGIGARSYLEFGTHKNETIGKVKCPKRYGVDMIIEPLGHPGVTMFAMTTEYFIKEFAAQHAPYDVVFIDASHDYESVERDFKGIWPLVSDEGLVLLHDVNPGTLEDTAPGLCGDAWKFALELRTLHQEYECVVLPYHPGLMIVRKRRKWGNW